MKYPIRHENHSLEEKSITFFRQHLPEDWNINSIDRDYGQDLNIEIAEDGKYKGLENSRPLLPPMPWQMYQNMTNEDLRSVFAYLKSLPAIKNVVPAPQSPQHLNDLASK